MPGVPLPLSRREECPKCLASPRACRGCDFYDTSASNDCREPMADLVAEKEAANLCDYFRPRMGPGAVAGAPSADAKAKLEAVFGKVESKRTGALAEEAAAGKSSDEEKAEAARKKLEALFGGKKD